MNWKGRYMFDSHKDESLYLWQLTDVVCASISKDVIIVSFDSGWRRWHAIAVAICCNTTSASQLLNAGMDGKLCLSFQAGSCVDAHGTEPARLCVLAETERNLDPAAS